MAKKKGSQRPKGKVAARRPLDNPFEVLKSHKKFDVLGRKKEKNQNKLKQRGAATELRKKTLLVEYKQLRKANAFIDRRFGEGDETLSQDERALARLQKQRANELAGNKYALPEEGDEIELTHLGKSLAEAEGLGQDWDEDLEDPYMKQLEDLYHFGGGKDESDELFTLKEGGEEEGKEEAAPRKTKAEVMAELIAKSKAFRAAKQAQREEDVNETEALDAAFKALRGKGALFGAVKKGRRQGGEEEAEAEVGDAAFDRAARELAFEAKGAAGDRLKTQEEEAAEEAARAERAERAQRLRAKLGLAEEDEDEAERAAADLLAAKGGFAARRARHEASQLKRKRGESGDALEDEDDFVAGSDDEDGLDSDEEGPAGGLEARQRRRAAGDHPLQAAFRQVAAKLLNRHTGEESEEEEDEEEDEEEEEGSELDDSELDGEEDDEEEEEGREGQSEEEGSQAPSDSEENATAEPEAADAPLTEDEPLDPEALPGTYAQFAACAAALDAEGLRSYVGRLRAVHAAQLAQGHRAGMQLFYGMLMQHFASVAARGGASAPALLDALFPHLLALTSAVPYYAATLARARLQRWSDRLSEALADPVAAADAWPQPGALSVMALLLELFPVLDRRHPVLTPLALLMGRYLVYCPVTRGLHAAIGLAMAGLLSAAGSPAQRFAPEPLRFATRALRSCVAGVHDDKETKESNDASSTSQGSIEDLSEAGLIETPVPDTWLAAARNADADAAFAPPSLSELAAGVDVERWATPAGAATLACVAARQVARSAAALEGCEAAPEALAPALAALEAVAASEDLPACVVAEARAARDAVKTRVEATLASRKPMLLAALLKLEESKQFNPRFEDGFVAGKDYDPDRERAERRKLQRQLRKEERGAARELRKDSAFMAGVRDRDKAAQQGAFLKSERRALSILEKQEADYRSGGQGGMWKKGKEKAKMR